MENGSWLAYLEVEVGGCAALLCQNPNVLEYDMIHTDTTSYCLYWEVIKGAKNRDILSFKNGSEINGRKKKESNTRKKSSK